VPTRQLRPNRYFLASYEKTIHQMKKIQIPSTKTQKNLKLQYPMTKTDELAESQNPSLMSLQRKPNFNPFECGRIGILNFGHCDLFGI